MFGLSTLMTRIALGLVAVVLLLGFLQVRSCTQAAQHRAERKIEKGQAGASINAGVEAQNTMSARAEVNEKIDQAVKEGTDEIREKSTPIAPASRDTALRAACRMRSYASDQRCAALRKAHPGDVAEGR